MGTVSRFLLLCCVIFATESANVTTPQLTELYKRFYTDVLELNSQGLTPQCRAALKEYQRGLRTLEISAVKSENKSHANKKSIKKVNFSV